MQQPENSTVRALLREIKRAYDLCSRTKFQRLSASPYQSDKPQPIQPVLEPAGVLDLGQLQRIQPHLSAIVIMAKVPRSGLSSDPIQMSNPDIIAMLQRMQTDIDRLDKRAQAQIVGLREAIDAEIAKIPLPQIASASAEHGGSALVVVVDKTATR